MGPKYDPHPNQLILAFLITNIYPEYKFHMQNIGNALSFATEKCMTLLILSLSVSSELIVVSYCCRFIRGMNITIDFINPPSNSDSLSSLSVGVKKPVVIASPLDFNTS